MNAKHRRWANANLDSSQEAAMWHNAIQWQGQLILKEHNPHHMVKSYAQWHHMAVMLILYISVL